METFLIDILLILACLFFYYRVIRMGKIIKSHKETLRVVGLDLSKTKRKLYEVQDERDILALRNSQDEIIKSIKNKEIH